MEGRLSVRKFFKIIQFPRDFEREGRCNIVRFDVKILFADQRLRRIEYK